VRFGNVLGSAGSVVPVFRDQIAAGGPVTVTHPEVKRYFMTIAEAVGLVLRAGYGDFGELCVLDMGEQIRIADLARHMITMAGHVPDEDIAIEYTGLRPGEKLFEELMTEEEESTREVAHKIFVASSPSPPADLDERIEELAEAASREDALAVVRLLLKVVPSYSPPHDYVALFAARGTIRAEIGDGGSEGPLPY
jgi:FlaA1/EpsC-like NDP-sugar epimerase